MLRLVFNTYAFGFVVLVCTFISWKHFDAGYWPGLVDRSILTASVGGVEKAATLALAARALGNVRSAAQGRH